MLRPQLAITGIGLASSLGDARTACAAARAGMSRSRPLAYEVEDPVAFEMVAVVGHPAGDGTQGFSEVGRLVRLGGLGLGDLLAGFPLTAGVETARMGVVINLPSAFYFEQVDAQRLQARKNARQPAPVPEVGATPSLTEAFEATKPLYMNGLVDKTFRSVGHAPPPKDRQHVIFGDASGFGRALTIANTLLTARTVSHCIVGGIDSLIEPRWLRALAELGILKTPLCPIGLMPGEAAAFLLLESISSHRAGQKVLATIDACEAGQEPQHRFSAGQPTGRVMADLMRRCIPPSCHEATLVSDLNGDPARSAELGAALVQLRKEFVPVTTLLPATSFGDTRAASGFLGACLAVHSFRRNCSKSNSFVICSAGDDGGRAVAVVNGPV